MIDLHRSIVGSIVAAAMAVTMLGGCLSSTAHVDGATPMASSTPYLLFVPLTGRAGTATLGPAPGSQDPALAPSSTPIPPPVSKPGYGVQVHLLAGDMQETLGWARGLGVDWVKQQVEWHTIEHGPDDLDWGLLDRAVAACDESGLKLLLGVVHAPDWTRAVTLESGPPQQFAEFGRFAGQLATRYRGRVEAYELWNEPNLAREWRGDTLDPARFVALVAEGARAVRHADPGAQIISGAPAVTGINDGVEAIDDRVYLRGMCEAGIEIWVDAVGAHPYGFANPPRESWENPVHIATSHNDHPSFFFQDTLEDYRTIIAGHCGSPRPIWVTEFGWASVENMGRMDARGWEYGREVSEAQQAAYIAEAYLMGEERLWVGPMFLWNLNLATIWGPDNPVSAYSILRPDRSYRPAYVALRTAEPLAR